MKKLLTILIAGMFILSMSLVLAVDNYHFIAQADNHQLEQYRNMFENNYQFECPGECDYGQGIGEGVQFQVKQQKRFLFWNVNAEETYTLDDEGNVVQAKYNFWSRLLNRDKVRI